MTDNPFMRLGNATASDIRNLKQPGLLLPIRKNDDPVILVNWDGVMHGVMLTGGHAFVHFPINLKRSHEGLFLPDVEVLLDVSSATSAAGRDEDEGLLILEENKLSVIARDVGDRHAFPQLVPLWTTVNGGSETTKVAFTRWGIGVPEGDTHRVVWQHEVTGKAG